mgnify:CR=1 FL=1
MGFKMGIVGLPNVGKSTLFRDAARVVNIDPRTAGALLLDRSAMIIELQRDADDFGPGARRERGHDGTVHAARHGDDDTAFGSRPRQVEQCSGLVRR